MVDFFLIAVGSAGILIGARWEYHRGVRDEWVAFAQKSERRSKTYEALSHYALIFGGILLVVAA